MEETKISDPGYPLTVVSSCLRSMFRAPKGYQFLICDLNAIENRGLGWVAGSKRILEVFEKKRCPYLDFSFNKLHAKVYAEMGLKTYEEVAVLHKQKDPTIADLRQKAKPPILGAGYRLGGGEEQTTEDGDKIKTGLWGYAANMGVDLTEEEAHEAVSAWRDDNPEVAGWIEGDNQWPTGGLWRDLEEAAFTTMKTGDPIEVGKCVFQAFGPKGDRKLFRIMLPSGRGLHYIRPKVEQIPFYGKPKKTLTYEGVDIKDTHKWCRIPTQGGKLTENIVQGVCRDLLLDGIFNAEERGIEIVGHVHDELIGLVPVNSSLTAENLRECMIATPEWAAGFPIDAEGFESEAYRKN